MRSILPSLFVTVAVAACSPATQEAPVSTPSSTPPAAGSTAPAASGPEAIARAFVADVAAGRYAAAIARYDDEMRAALPEAKLAAAWSSAIAAAGALLRVDAASIETRGALRAVKLTGSFASGRRELRVVIGAGDRVSGFFIFPVEEDLLAAGRAFVDALARGDLGAATAGFDATMASAMPPAKLGAAWAQINAQAGAFGGVEEAHLKRDGAYWTVFVTCRFAKVKLAAKVVFDAQAKVAGLFFVPAESAAAWQPPPYARPDAFAERAVNVGTAPALPGTLTLPKGAGPFPVAILVHGSGPGDADETVAAAKPFKDLAWGLAGRGVAVLRYVKRTRHAPAGVTTVKEEVHDAVREAIALCKATPELDAKRIVVVGHSQGAGEAPRIAAENKEVAAIVMLAAPSRPLQDLVVDQLTYFASLDPGNAELAKKVQEAVAFKKRLDDPGLQPEDEIAFPSGGSSKGAYYLSMRGYKPAEVAASLKIPVLLLQGDRDYQVTAPDLAGFKRALAGKANVTIKQYPALNHLFIAGTGKPQPSEYEKPGHVDEQVIVDIAAFAGKLPR